MRPSLSSGMEVDCSDRGVCYYVMVYHAVCLTLGSIIMHSYYFGMMMATRLAACYRVSAK